MLTSYFMLIFAEAITNCMETQYISHIRTALDACWSVLENRDKRGEELYRLLDDGTDFSGIFIYMQQDENEANTLLWDNISYAIGVTAKEAFEFENKKELPSPIENIEPGLLDDFIENLKEIVSQYAYPNFLTDLQIVKSNFGSYSGCFGAMMYILNS